MILGSDGYDLVIVAVEDERRHVELLEIFGEVRLRERLDAIVDGFVSSQHSLKPERIPQALRDLGARPVGTVERSAEVFEKLCAIGEDCCTNLVEGIHRQATGIGWGLQHQRRHRADEPGLGDTLCAVATDIAGDFSAAGRVPYMDRVFEVEPFDQLREVVRIGIHFVAIPWLVRSAVAATVMGDATISAGSQKQHLVFKCVRAEWPAMAEYDWLSPAPVFVINPCTAFFRDRGTTMTSFRFGLRRWSRGGRSA